MQRNNGRLSERNTHTSTVCHVEASVSIYHPYSRASNPFRVAVPVSMNELEEQYQSCNDNGGLVDHVARPITIEREELQGMGFN